jgi:ubiquinol-cytochrome c reductase cytochrome b subunit
LLNEPIPGGARFAYVFGSALLFIFLSQIVTGICLALYYVPDPTIAHTTVAYIVKEVAAGSFLRSLHSYGSSAMIVVLVLHFLQTILYGSYKGKRQLLWISGGLLALFVMGMTFTGYLLSWDQSAYSSGAVGTDIVGQVPFIGETLRRLVRGGTGMGALTLSRFYVLHILLIPVLILSLVATHLVLFRKAGAAGPASEDPFNPQLPTERFYPKQVLIDMVFVLLVMGTLGMLAHFVPVTLGLEANPSNTTYLPRPEWYFLPMFQWLKYWEGWRTVIGVFVIPLILGGLLFSLPFIDRGRERRPWRRPIPVASVLIVFLGMIWLGMTSRLDDSRDPAVAARLAQQRQEEDAYSHSAFQPYSESSSPGGAASASGGSAASEGKGIFNSHGCIGCHGAIGGGGKGPALTHIASKYQPAQLTALLKAPTAAMRAGGMVALTLDDAKLKALVAYLGSLGGASAGAVAAPTSATSPAPGSTAPSEPSQAPAPTSSASAPAVGEPLAKAMPGKAIYESHGCTSCHGTGGTGTKSAPALTDVGKRFSATQVARLLRAPNAKMKAGGMPPVTVGVQKLTSLVAYVRSLDSIGSPQRKSAAQKAVQPAHPVELSAATTPANPGSKPNTGPDQSGSNPASANPSDQRGETVFKAHGCAACHGASGVGTSRAPALAKLAGNMTATALAKVLQHPTHAMQAGGMPTVELKSEDMTALVAYLRSLGTPVGERKRDVSSPDRPANPVAGKRIYAQHCADCHGPTGKGDGTVGRALRLTPTDFTATTSDDAEWLKVIELGSKATGKSDGMKGFAGELTDVQIRDVLAHVKTLMK